MKENRTIFQKIIDRELPAEIVFENSHVIAIEDIHPQAPVHLLIITKKVIPSLQEIEERDLFLLGEMAKAAQKLAKERGVEKGYRLLSNIGAPAGQTIHHLHFHLLGGKTLGHLG